MTRNDPPEERGALARARPATMARLSAIVAMLPGAGRSRLGRFKRGCVAAGLLVLTLTGYARASGFAVPQVGDPHGHPAMANPYAIFFNPGAVGGAHGTHLVLDASLIYRTVDVERAPSALSPLAPSLLADPTYVAANTGSSHAGNVLAVPFLAATSDFGSRRFFGGVGVYVPFGGAVQFDQRDAFANRPDARGAVDGSQRWAVISADQTSLYNTAVVGVRWPEIGLSFGVGTSLVWNRIRHDQARNSSGDDNTSTEGRALLEVSSLQLAMNAGLYWEVLPKDALRIGLSYAIRPGFGEMTMNGTLRQTYGASDAVRDVAFRQTYPDVIRFGIASRVSRSIELRYDADYTTWSVLNQQCIVARGEPCRTRADGSEDREGTGQIVLALRRGWRDTGGMRFGLGYFADERSELYASAGYETSAVPKATIEATYPDAFKFITSLGARRKLSELLTMGASATWVAYLPVTASGQRQAALIGASKMPNEDGTYRSRVLFFNLNAAFSF
jgi:long-chain fatty acid transport protein